MTWARNDYNGYEMNSGTKLLGYETLKTRYEMTKNVSVRKGRYEKTKLGTK